MSLQIMFNLTLELFLKIHNIILGSIWAPRLPSSYYCHGTVNQSLNSFLMGFYSQSWWNGLYNELNNKYNCITARGLENFKSNSHLKAKNDASSMLPHSSYICKSHIKVGIKIQCIFDYLNQLVIKVQHRTYCFIRSHGEKIGH